VATCGIDHLQGVKLRFLRRNNLASLHFAREAENRARNGGRPKVTPTRTAGRIS